MPPPRPVASSSQRDTLKARSEPSSGLYARTVPSTRATSFRESRCMSSIPWPSSSSERSSVQMADSRDAFPDISIRVSKMAPPHVPPNARLRPCETAHDIRRRVTTQATAARGPHRISSNHAPPLPAAHKSPSSIVQSECTVVEDVDILDELTHRSPDVTSHNFTFPERSAVANAGAVPCDASHAADTPRP